MRAVSRRSLRLLPLLLAFLAGCGSPPPPPEAPLPASYRVSRDGVLHYEVPDGWFDATADTQSSGPVIWILRKDYGATITVNEIHLDPQARRDLARGGLLQVGQLTQGLSVGDGSTLLLHPAEIVRSNGREFCTYELLTSNAQDTVRVLLFNTGEHIYSVSALRQGSRAGGPEVFTVQEGFVNGLRW